MGVLCSASPTGIYGEYSLSLPIQGTQTTVYCTGAPGMTRPVMTEQDYYDLWPLLLTMLVVAYGVRVVRKLFFN
ncbi:MAG: hypothetical protein AAGI72_06320 [Pseudomonadota bacterium]